MTEKVYMLGEIGFAYNDETYYQSENGGAHPRRCFKSKEVADQECRQLNIRELAGLESLAHYCYDWEEITDNLGALVAWFKKHGIDLNDDNRWDNNMPGELPDEEWAALLDLISIRWWQVYEVDYDGEEPIP